MFKTKISIKDIQNNMESRNGNIKILQISSKLENFIDKWIERKKVKKKSVFM